MNIRLRRNRKNHAIRSMVEETQLSTQNLIYPLFVEDGKSIKTEILSLPNNFRWSLDNLIVEVEQCLRFGIDKYVLFQVVE